MNSSLESGQRVPVGQQRQPAPPLIQVLSPAPQQAWSIKTPFSTGWQQVPLCAWQLSQNSLWHTPSSPQVSSRGSQHSLPHGTRSGEHTHNPLVVSQILVFSQHTP